MRVSYFGNITTLRSFPFWLDRHLQLAYLPDRIYNLSNDSMLSASFIAFVAQQSAALRHAELNSLHRLHKLNCCLLQVPTPLTRHVDCFVAVIILSLLKRKDARFYSWTAVQLSLSSISIMAGSDGVGPISLLAPLSVLKPTAASASFWVYGSAFRARNLRNLVRT